MEFAKGEGLDWRMEMDKWIRTNLAHTVFNPNVESDIFMSKKLPSGRFRELKSENLELYVTLVRELIDIDSHEISDRSDYVICNWDESAQRGAGTKGELTMARFTGKPVFMVTHMNLHDIPGWVLGCTTKIFGSFDELKIFLMKEYGGKEPGFNRV
jgi:hypothetical protein